METLNSRLANDDYGPFSQSKALAHIDRLHLLAKKKLPPPVTVEIDLADGFCNQKCPHCFFSTPEKMEAQKPTFFPRKRARSLGNELKSIGVRAIEFPGGGEPTTHPEFAEVIEAFGSCQLPMGLVTNGMLCKKIVPVVNRFNWIRVSLDAPTEEVYRKTHGSSKFDQVLKGIERLISERKKTKIGLGYLITPENAADLGKAVALAEELGVDYIQFRPASLVRWGSSPLREKVVASVHNLLNSDRKVVIYIQLAKWDRIANGRSFPTCDTSALVGIIKADGTVPFCCLKRDKQEEYLGNVLENSFSSIWYSEIHRQNAFQVNHKTCPIPCKHDAYNEIFHSLKKGQFDEMFL